MDVFGLIAKGVFVPEVVSSVPQWSSSDKGRIIYVTSENRLYYATDTEWVIIGQNVAASVLESQVFS